MQVINIGPDYYLMMELCSLVRLESSHLCFLQQVRRPDVSRR